VTPIANVFLLVTFGSILSVLIALLSLARKNLFERLHLYLVAFAAGTLIGTALFDLFPEAIEHSRELGIDGDTTFVFVAAGIALFFLMEKFFHWYHDHAGHGYHHEHGEGHHHVITKAVVPLITVGDGLHNFLDGALIAATTLTDPSLGLVTAIAVFLHEIPQEVGDFSVLIFGGVSRNWAILLNILTAATAYLGALVTFYLSGGIEILTVPLVAFTAGAFLFISLGELLPELVHRGKDGLRTVLLALVVILAIYFVRYYGQLLGVAH